MNALREIVEPVSGRLDGEGRLIEADPALAALHEHAGGRPGGTLAVPQIATLARLARRLGIIVARPAIAADGERDIDLWVRAEPQGADIALEISGWTVRATTPAPEEEAGREADFERAAADWTFETDEMLGLTFVSAGAASLGFPGGELIGRRLTNLLRFRESADGALPILTALAERGRFDDQLAELPGGSRFLLSGVPLIDGMGRFAGFRGSASRVDGDAPAEPSTLELTRSDEVDSAAFGERLDDALRTPLNHIVAAAELLRAQDDGPLRREYAAYAGDIASAGRHLLAMVDDLVDLQAIERSDFRPDTDRIDLADIARRAAGLLSVRAAERGVRIDKPGEGDSLPANGEFRRVLQIMMNLLVNAIRYSPEGGMVWIRFERDGDTASVTVADLGKGIAPDDQARIFDKFERVDPSEPGGTGLGLYIARRLARAMGGDLVVDSAPGQGARFTLTLPAA